MRKPAAESLEYFDIGYVVSDTDQKVLILNRSAREILKSAGVIEKLSDVVSYLPERLQILDHVKYCGLEKRSCSFKQVEIGDKHVRVYLSPIFDKGELAGNLLTLEDITEKREQERAREQFLATLVHELRTPLTAVKGNSLLLDEVYAGVLKDKNFQNIVSDITAGSHNVLQMVNEFLEMSRLEEGRITYDLKEFDIVTVVREVSDSLKVLAKNRPITLKTAFADDLKKLNVVADENRSRQVLTNLISNAIKFTEKGDVTVELKKVAEKAGISVSDTGAGIPKESQANLFKKYFQASNNPLRHDSSKSTGLGLYMTKLMVEGMDGQVFLTKSEEGKGSTFTFTLDIATKARLEHLKTQQTEAKQGVEHGEVSEHVSVSI